MILRSVLALLLAAGTTETAQATDCQRLTHDGQGYTICEVGIRDDLRLFLTAPDGMPFGSFDRIDAALASEGVRLGFAMNAGMYHPDRSPVGLYLDPGGEVARIVTAAGPGNFGMRPNGVFCIGPDSLAIVESRAFAETPPDCRYATQSGPMLVIGGELHPRFLVDAASRYVRNGVGVSADGQRAIFAISDRRVTFHEFARLFRDGLGTPDALYLDGNVSRLHAPALNRSDRGRPLGPIVGTVVPVDAAQSDG
jgi:uncharacterized protein YigE (DUF2233 family)